MPDETTIRLDRFTRLILTALTVLLTIIAIELWVGRPGSLPVANAQIPDTGYQRQQIVEETRKTNELLGRILEQLKSKPIQVRIVADEMKDSGAARGGREG
jgi:hypothetical protein